MKHRKHRGFALVVTLTLLVILTVIAVAMLGLSTISLRSNSQGEAMATARANARMSMMLALGELQKELGPDQRISAPGSQLLEEANITGPKHWTGVYDSWKGASWPFTTSEEIRPSTPTFRRWLISGDETDAASVVRKKDAPKDGLSGDKVKLVSAIKALGTTPAQDAVEAGLVKLPKGGGAWWVGDQNTKAKLGGVVKDAADVKEASARLQSAPRAGHEVFQGLDGVLPSDERLGKLPSTDSLELLSKDIQPFHDATTTSLGLLTNVRAGGLRKDLNFFLEKPIPTAGSAATVALYNAGTSPTAAVAGQTIPSEGINLGELWVDHNIWGELQYGPPAHADGSSLPSGAPYLECGAKADPFINYKHLPRLQLTQLYSLTSKSSTVAGKKVYDLYLATDPIFTIWNPFNVCLHVPQSYFATLKTWAIPYDLNLNLQGGPLGSKSSYSNSIGDIYRLGGAGNAVFVFQGTLGNVSKTSQNLVLRPGEVQVMAQGFGAPIKYNPTGVDWDSKLGWEFASGYAYKIDYETNNTYKTGAQRITYSMAPNAKKSDNTALMLWSYGVPGANPFIGSFNINFINSRLSGQGEITANNFPTIFPTLPLNVSAFKTIAELENNKWPICVFTYGLRTESDPFPTSGTRSTGRSMLRANATSLAQDLFNLDPAVVRTSPLQVGMRRVNSLSGNIVECDSKGLGYYGAGYGSDMGVSHVITRSIPREPIHSLGALQHAAAEGKRFGQSPGEKSWFLQPSVSHAIANSFAPSCLGPSAVRGTLAGWPVADHSYLANLALWDTYFYSSIKPRTKSAHRSTSTAYSEQKKRLEDFLATGTAYKPLPNERMRPWIRDPAAALKAIFPSTSPVSNAADLTASFLMVDGMFNVNSTSVAAWKSFLSGLKKAKLPSNPSPVLLSQAKMIEGEGTAVAALLEAAGEEIDDTTLSDPTDAEQWRGFRSLSDEQIEELAKAIVKQVRKRGPFLSIADFVNRRPGSDKVLALSGALQSALDDTDVSINEAYRQGSRSLSPAEAQAKGFPFPEAEAGPKAIGSPGYVKQGDLLTTLGPMVAVRGDTFVIRGYGEAREGNGTGSKVTARAWCEATVQRVPEFVDPANNSYDAPAVVNANAVNKTLGRRFNIVSFRYLDPRDF